MEEKERFERIAAIEAFRKREERLQKDIERLSPPVSSHSIETSLPPVSSIFPRIQQKEVIGEEGMEKKGVFHSFDLFMEKHFGWFRICAMFEEK